MGGFSYFGQLWPGGYYYLIGGGTVVPTGKGILGWTADGRGIYSRRSLLYVVSGALRAVNSDPRLERVRRIWPDEPNVGFVEEQMAFLIDGALKIGGPSAKTYDINNYGTTGWARETRLYHDDSLGKLRGSENAEAAADVFNAVGYWYSETSPAAGDPVVWETEVLSDASTYSFSGGVVSLLRPGVYRIGWRSYAVPDAGNLKVTLGAGSDSVRWEGSGLSTDLGASDELIYVKTDTTTTPATLTLDVGTSLGAAKPKQTALSIQKMR